MAEHNDLGKFGEELAVDFLEKNGYEILETNWVFDKAEIDIIAQKEKNKKSIHHHQNDSSYKPKEVFSFKHNGFRNNSPSDMIRPLPL